jgi:hypothetical protein
VTWMFERHGWRIGLNVPDSSFKSFLIQKTKGLGSMHP